MHSDRASLGVIVSIACRDLLSPANTTRIKPPSLLELHFLVWDAFRGTVSS